MALALQLMDVSMRVEDVREYAVQKSVALLVEPSLITVSAFGFICVFSMTSVVFLIGHSERVHVVCVDCCCCCCLLLLANAAGGVISLLLLLLLLLLLCVCVSVLHLWCCVVFGRGVVV